MSSYIAPEPWSPGREQDKPRHRLSSLHPQAGNTGSALTALSGAFPPRLFGATDALQRAGRRSSNPGTQACAGPCKQLALWLLMRPNQLRGDHKRSHLQLPSVSILHPAGAKGLTEPSSVKSSREMSTAQATTLSHVGLHRLL